jgi:20S proteasome alpha/beta subunit
MTFVIGFRCSDGIVLCTDSLEADGVTKRYVDKTKIIGTTDWSVAIAGAGPGGFIDKFTSDISANLPRGAYDRKEMETTIEDALSRFRSQYQEPFRILVGVQCTWVIDYGLYRSDDNYLVPIKDHTHIGMGHSLWRFFAENLYTPRNSVEDNSRLAIFIMRQAINYVDGVDEPIRLVSYTFGDQNWKLTNGPFFLALEKHQNGFRHCDAGKALRDSWESCNPPSMSEQVSKFGSVRTPGDELTFLDGVKMERLGSVSGQNTASNSFWCNRDRLRKRALLEQGRAQSEKKPNR